MQPKHKREKKAYPQTEGNLALSGENLGLPRELRPKSRLRLVQDISEEKDNPDVLAKEIFAVAGMSLVLCIMWFIIILLIYRIVV